MKNNKQDEEKKCLCTTKIEVAFVEMEQRDSFRSAEDSTHKYL